MRLGPFHRFSLPLFRRTKEEAAGAERLRWDFYGDYARQWNDYLGLRGVEFPKRHAPRHVFACFFQIRRAFHYIFRSILGSSMPAARVRAVDGGV